jgi:hypothetical protein
MIWEQKRKKNSQNYALEISVYVTMQILVCRGGNYFSKVYLRAQSQMCLSMLLSTEKMSNLCETSTPCKLLI